MRQLTHYVQHLAHHLRVKGAGRLIEEHDLRFHHQRAHDGHALLLPAGKLDRIGACAILKPYAAQQRACLFLGGFLWHLLHLNGRKRHVFQDRLVGEEVEVLEYHAHLFAVPVHVQPDGFAVGSLIFLLRHVHAVKHDAAARGFLQQVQRAQEGGLARAGRPDDHHHVAAGNVHRDAVERLDGALVVVLFQVGDRNQLIACRHGSSSSQNAR